MPVNDFEKQVQQKMDELQLRPSTEVWEEVERRIRKEKKRRWFILWFFLLGAVLVGGTGWWLVTTNKYQTTTDKVVAKIITGKKSVNQSITEENNITTSTTISEKNNDEIKIGNEKIATTQNSVSPTGKTEKNINTQMPVTSEVVRNNNKKSKKVSNSVMVSLKKNSKDIKEPGTTVAKAADQSEIIPRKDENDIADAEKNKIIRTDLKIKGNDSVAIDKTISVVISEDDKLKTSTLPTQDSLMTTKPDEPVAKKDSNKTKRNKWEIGVTGMAGISGKSDGISIFGMEKSLDAANLSNVNNPGTGGQSAVVPPGQTGNGFAWQLGAYGKRKLSARTSFSIGLGFSLYSSTQATGAYVDSSRVYNNNLYAFSTSSFYRSGNGRVYTNNYYYLQLPFAFHWQVNKGKKLSIVFQNGFSTGYFIGSDALVYNAGSNVFYTDNKSFNKLQLSYQSGLYAKLFNHSKKPLTAGFLFNYHLSKQQKVNIYGGNHLTSFGIQLGWVLKK